MNSIEINSLSKKFGNVLAVDDISLKVNEGEIFGFLGPNGAGKSTTMMILTTLLKPTSGNALVAGYDVVSDAKHVRENIGYVQQELSVDEYLTGRENLILQARLNHIPKSLVNERIDEILNLIELTEKQDAAVITYSGGMRKRLDIAGGLLHHPKVLFLDEPTSGLDPEAAKLVRDFIEELSGQGRTIFICTHNLDEADRLCDRIAVFKSRLRVVDTPGGLRKQMYGRQQR